MPQEKDSVLEQLKKKLPKKLFDLLEQRDGAARLIKRLPKTFDPQSLAQNPDGSPWDLIGFLYRQGGRFHEALSIYHTLYDHVLLAQQKDGRRFHKATPLLWISECYTQLGFPVHAKRYLMLAHCEDSISLKGVVSPGGTGVYFRMVWGHGITDAELRRYARQIYALWQKDPTAAQFPEWILQNLDQNWMTEFPSPREAIVYTASTSYMKHLLSQLGKRTGTSLEILADYLLSCMPGCRTMRRQKTQSTDYDIICSMEGFDVDFRSELGRYFVCECKDWHKPADFSTIAKFCRVLDSTKSRFGILFSSKGISGEGRTRYAEREQLKIFQDRGMVIVVITAKDIERVARGANFNNILRSKYMRVRLDLIT